MNGVWFAKPLGESEALLGSRDGVRVQGRTIYLFDSITPASAQALIEALFAVDQSTTYEQRHYKVPIILQVNSPGGDIFSSFGAADMIAAVESPVHSVIAGCACSGATILSTACRKRFITRNSFMMIHQLSAGVWGTFADIEDEKAMLDTAMERLVEHYQTHSKMGRDEVRDKLSRNSYFGAAGALQYGLIDAILR